MSFSAIADGIKEDLLVKLSDAEAFLLVKPSHSSAVLKADLKYIGELNSEDQLRWHQNLLRASISLNDADQVEATVRSMLSYPDLSKHTDKLISMLSGLGIFMRRQGHVDESLYLFDCALQQQFTNYKQTLSLLISKGNSLRHIQQLDKAKKTYEIALEVAKAQQEDGYLGTIYNALGAMAFDLGRHEEAKQYFIESMQTSQKISRRTGQVIAGLNLLTLSLVKKDPLIYHRLISPIRQLTQALDNQDKKYTCYGLKWPIKHHMEMRFHRTSNNPWYHH